jgi:RNA polymerase sigma-70 factor (ECF subfamily)
MNSQASRPDRFMTTRWSMVMQLAATESGNARNALGELARRYWYPVYVYIRRCGHPRAGATDLARRFLQQLMGDVSGESGQAAYGHYRSYLLARLNTFLAGEQSAAASAIGEDLDMPTDLEERYQQDHVDALSPEQSYQRAFALQVLHRTLRRLRNEASQTGHVDMYDQLEPFLAREPGPGEYEMVATRLRNRPLTLVVALKRLRQRFRELAADELVDTVATAADLATEQEALLAVLSDIRS